MYYQRLLKKFFAVLIALAVSASPALAKEIELRSIPGSPFVLSGKKHTVPLKISLTGLQGTEGSEQRAALNVALVLDRSGSMSGEKLRKAREAAIRAINLLRADDIISVAIYDHAVQVIVPATKLTDKASVIQAVNNIQSGGNTALFAGVSSGASETRKFMSDNRVNRIILLSDGLANVGPSTPGELGTLGASLAQNGISVSTIGLGAGYNEDLMTALSGRSDGNHDFVEHAGDLTRIFAREFGDIMSVVAQNIEITITCSPGVRPVRVIGRDAQIHGQKVITSFNQIYAEQDKYLVLEVELPVGESGEQRTVASVQVEYSGMNSPRKKHLNSVAHVTYTNSEKTVAEHVQRDTLQAYYEQLVTDRNKLAVQMRDAGRKQEAQKLLRSNAAMLRKNSKRYGISSLEKQAAVCDAQADGMDLRDWNVHRKGMVEQQYKSKANIK